MKLVQMTDEVALVETKPFDPLAHENTDSIGFILNAKDWKEFDEIWGEKISLSLHYTKKDVLKLVSEKIKEHKKAILSLEIFRSSFESALERGKSGVSQKSTNK